MALGRGGVRLSPALEDISFRPLMARDIDAVEALHKRCFPIRYSRKFFEALLRASISTLCAFNADGQLAGFVSGRVEAVGWCGMHEEGYIMTLGVDEQYRRRKLASYLLQRMMTELRTLHEVTDITLHVQITNDAAMRLYTGLGYSMVAHLPDYYEIDGATHTALKLLHRPVDYQPSCMSWLTAMALFALCHRGSSHAPAVAPQGLSGSSADLAPVLRRCAAQQLPTVHMLCDAGGSSAPQSESFAD